jgi:sarcosine oxidase subunit beta
MTSTDVVVIGGGAIGSSAAYYLSKENMKVTLLERFELASEASGANMGGFCSQLIKGSAMNLARESARMYRSLGPALEYDFELEPTGSYILMDKEDQWPILEENAKRLWDEHGVKVDLLSGKELIETDPDLAPDIPGASRFSEDFTLNPAKLVFGFAEAARKHGAEIDTHTEVEKICIENGNVKSVITNRGKIGTKFLVIAAGAWSPYIGKMLDLRIPVIPRRGQLLVTDACPLGKIRYMNDIDYLVTAHNLEAVKTACDTRIRLGVSSVLSQPRSGNWLIGSSRDFPGYDKRTTIETLISIARRAVRFLPKLRHANIIRTFAGLRPYCEDDQLIIDKVEEIEGVVLATGHHGEGIALAPATGKLVADLVTSRRTSCSIEDFSYYRFRGRQPTEEV